jgi:hypothetical protein
MSRAIQDATACREALVRLPELDHCAVASARKIRSVDREMRWR